MHIYPSCTSHCTLLTKLVPHQSLYPPHKAGTTPVIVPSSQSWYHTSHCTLLTKLVPHQSLYPPHKAGTTPVIVPSSQSWYHTSHCTLLAKLVPTSSNQHHIMLHSVCVCVQLCISTLLICPLHPLPPPPPPPFPIHRDLYPIIFCLP